MNTQLNTCLLLIVFKVHDKIIKYIKQSSHEYRSYHFRSRLLLSAAVTLLQATYIMPQIRLIHKQWNQPPNKQ